MCTSPDAYVATRVYERLLERGVDARKAEGIARKVQRSYQARRLRGPAFGLPPDPPAPPLRGP
jgi:hypothetical protein